MGIREKGAQLKTEQSPPMGERKSSLRSDTVGHWCVSYGGLSCRQTPFPADVYEARGDDDGAYRTNNHQNHKEFAVVAAFLPGREGAADGCAVVLDANLRRQRECTTNPSAPNRKWSPGTRLCVRNTCPSTSGKTFLISPSIVSTSLVFITPGKHNKVR